MAGSPLLAMVQGAISAIDLSFPAKTAADLSAHVITMCGPFRQRPAGKRLEFPGAGR
jgi:hypothetical protein